MARSDALDLEPAIFKQRSPRRIAESLKRSAERSHRRKSSPFRSAMSMLTFYINRGGRNLSAARKQTLERAKVELRHLFGREPTTNRSADRGPSSKRPRSAAGARRTAVTRKRRAASAR
jgi:hypothetical protein